MILLLLACGADPAKEPSGGAAGDSAAPQDSGGLEGGEGGDIGGGGEEGGGETAEPVDPLCVEAPVVTYNNFGEGFMVESCQSCHASTAPDRVGAPESVSFDNVEQCWTWRDRILARAAGDEPTMPPLGGVDEDERLLLQIWLTCAEPGT
jgi:hypothetical protein